MANLAVHYSPNKHFFALSNLKNMTTSFKQERTESIKATTNYNAINTHHHHWTNGYDYWLGYKIPDQQMIIPELRVPSKPVHNDVISFNFGCCIEHSILDDIGDDLLRISRSNSQEHSAMKFIPILAKLRSIDLEDILFPLGWRFGKHVLVENEYLKLVLIVWCPGEKINKHGHPKAGCVFTILEGNLEEERFDRMSSEFPISSSTLTSGSISYIDDKIGYHTVANPGSNIAVSLHAYIPEN